MPRYDCETDEDEGLALALTALMEVEGEDEIALAQLEALALVVEEGVAIRERREAREQEAQLRRERAEEQRREADRRARRVRHEQAAQARAEAEELALARREALRRRRIEAHRRLHKETGQQPAHAQRPVARPPIQRIEAKPVQRILPASHAPGRQPRVVERSEPMAKVMTPSPECRRGTVSASMPAPSVPKDDRVPMLTGADLGAWRERLGLTQSAAADRLGVRQGTISKAEGRAARTLGETLQGALAEALSK